jgi:hypothetical protein
VDYKSLTSLVVRLTGVIIIVSSITAAPQTFIALLYRRGVDAAGNIDMWLVAVVASAFPLIVGFALIYFPGTVTNRVVSAGAEPVDSLALQQVAFSVLGLYFVTVAAYDAVYWWAKLRIYFAIYNELNFGRPDRLTQEDFAGLAATSAQFVAGVTLLFGGRGLANLFHRLRSPPALNSSEEREA